MACGGDVASRESGAEGREVVDVSASLEALLGSGVRIGAHVDPDSEAEAFLRILDAQLTPDGRFIVALDGSPPFVRVFNPDGSLEAAFVPRGEGPGEAESPEALAVSNDRILVLEPGRASALTFDGELIGDRAIEFWPTSAARGCADDFLTGAAILDQTPILSAWLIVASGTESGTHFIPARGGSPAFYTSSRVALLEAQPGQAVLLEASFPVPHIIMVDYDAFVRALGMEPR